MKDKGLTKEEIGSILLAKKALSKFGHGSMINVKELCSEMGMSGKAAYSYYRRLKGKKKVQETKDKERDDILKDILRPLGGGHTESVEVGSLF